MNIIIFTPVCSMSAITRTVTVLIKVLKNKGHTVVAIGTEEESFIETSAQINQLEIISWKNKQQVEKFAAAADIIIYQIGNNYSFHAGCLEWLPKIPGIVYLHDYFLGHLFKAWSEKNRLEAQNILRSWYSKKIQKTYFKYAKTSKFIEKTYQIAPLTEWIAAMAVGVITHSAWNIQSILKACPGPVKVIPLTYEKLLNSNENKKDIHHSLLKNFTIVTVGDMNANKRMTSVIRAIGKSKLLREHVTYELAGAITLAMQQELNLLAKRKGVNIKITGRVSDQTLLTILEQADVVCCLRFPVTEAASASTIEALLHGKAVIVTNTGFYQEISDDYVYKIDPKKEIEELTKKLEFLYLNPEVRIKIGKAAAQWAKMTFNAEDYADNLLSFIPQVKKAVPVLNALNYFSQLLRQWQASEAIFLLPDSIEPLKIFGSTTDKLS